ncbi:MAG TPA: VWA domain-containing protein [Candidatus Solibacter sp.]|jgi:Ca-activated chloride channel family protein
MLARGLVAAVFLLGLCFAEGPGIFHAQSSLVLVNVSVLDAHDRPVTGLSREEFRILDNGREQPIRFFAHDDAPLSLAIVLDSSGSMNRKWNRARTMLARFCEQLGPEDEFFLLTVEQQVRLLVDYTSNCGAMQNRLVTAKPHGMTALVDAIPWPWSICERLRIRAARF